MSNDSGRIERAPLPLPNSPTITAADRTRIYEMIGKELNNIINGSASYYPDGGKRNSYELLSELQSLIGAVGRLRDSVNDPANVMEDVIRELETFGKAFKAGVSNDIEWMWADPKDPRDLGIKLPDSVAPTTEDHNVIDVDSNPDPFYPPPNPFSPPKDRRVSVPALGNRYASRSVPAKPGASAFAAPNNPPAPAPPASFDDRFGSWRPSPQSGGLTQVDPQKIRYLRRVDPDDIDSVSQPPGPNTQPQPAGPLGLVSGKPMSNYPVPRMLLGFSDRPAASGDNMDDWFNRWIKPLMEQ